MNTLWRERVLVQLRGNVLGPIPVSDLRRLSGFTSQTMISFPGSEKWAPAFRVLNQQIFADCPLEISPLEDSRPPSMNAFPDIFAPHTPKRMKISDFTATDGGRTVTDRWFRRLAIVNLMLALAVFSAWSYLPLRTPLQYDLQLQTSQ